MEAKTSKSDNVKNGLLFGLVIGLIYCISLFTRYNLTSSGIVTFTLISLLFYFVVIGMLFFCGIKRRSELGGYIELKDAFQTIFIAVLIAELIYSIFNIVYLKFIDPHFFEKFEASMEDFLQRTIKDDNKRDEAVSRVKEQMENRRLNALTFRGIVLGYLISVAVTGVFGLLTALIIRKTKPVFELDNQS